LTHNAILKAERFDLVLTEEVMDNQRDFGELLQALRQLAEIHQRIAQSLDTLEKLWVDEARKRDEDRQASKDWMMKSEEKAAQYLKDPAQAYTPKIPWQVTAMWVLGILVLTLAAVMFFIAIFQQLFGST
jgi:hypothetical protein